eukprot:COSAG02_NODE_2669_length_8290_cov_8.246856_3_plen_55_part_00
MRRALTHHALTPHAWGDHGTLQIPLGVGCVGRMFWTLLHQGWRVVRPLGSSDYC